MDPQKPDVPAMPNDDAAPTPANTPTDPVIDDATPSSEVTEKNTSDESIEVAVHENAGIANAAPESGSSAPLTTGPSPVTDPLLTPDADSAWTPTPGPATPALPDASALDELSTTPVVVSSAAPVPKPKNKKKLWLKALIVGGVVLFLGGASAAAYYGYYLPNKPDTILKTALVNSFTDGSIKSASFDGTMDLESSAEGLALGGTFKGKASSAGPMELTVDIDALVTKIMLDVRSVDGKSYYFKVSGLDGLPELLGAADDPTVKSYASFIALLDEQWLEINESLMKSFGVDTSAMTPDKADLKKLSDMYKRHPVLKVSQKLPDETIKNTPSYHFKVLADKAALKALYTELKNANIKGLKVTQKDIDNLNKMIKDINFAKYPVDIWIAKDRKIINQVSTKLTVDEMTIDFKVTLFDFNKPFEVTKPEGAKSLLEVLGDALGQGAAAPDSKILKELESSGISL